MRYTSAQADTNYDKNGIMQSDPALKKLSYSRLLADLTEKDILQTP
jgi:hypothetical protein